MRLYSNIGGIVNNEISLNIFAIAFLQPAIRKGAIREIFVLNANRIDMNFSNSNIDRYSCGARLNSSGF